MHTHHGIKPAPGVPAPDEKTIATLKAKFALKGFVMSQLLNDGRVIFAVSRWGQSRVFSHLHDVRAFLTQVGG